MPRSYPKPLLVAPALARDLEAIENKTVEGEVARHKLGQLLQSALQLEFATIAPYLSAAYSIVDHRDAIRQLIIRVAKEEMLHMTAVANLINAIGIEPNIIQAVPEYPFDLDTIAPPLRLTLQSFSFQLVETLFMRIEAPEEPVEFPTPLAAGEERPRTIGQFYKGIIDLIESDTIPNLFDNAQRDSYKQIPVIMRFAPVRYLNDADTGDYPLQGTIDFMITDKNSAVRHLNWIISEGEGAAKFNPLGPEGLPGHYYRFESILESKYLIKDGTVDLGYSYSGGSLPFSEAGVHEFDPNPKVENYAAWPQVQTQMQRFNEKFSTMVASLEAAFNCPDPAQAPQAKAAFDEAISAMRDMPGLANRIIVRAKAANIKAGLPFQYIPSDQPI